MIDGNSASHFMLEPTKMPRTFEAVAMWARIFSLLKWVSLFELVRRAYPGAKSHGAVDLWVTCHLFLAATAIVASAYVLPTAGIYLIVAYAVLRVFEVTVYQINVLLFDEYRSVKEGRPYALRGYRRLVVLLLSNYVEIVLWFGAIYLSLPGHFTFNLFAPEKTVLDGLYSSFIIMSTFGDPNVTPTTRSGMLIILYHSIVGLFMTAVMIARFFGVLPRPKSSDEMEGKSD